MIKRFEPPFMITLKSSRRLRWVMIAVHCLAMAAAIANALPVVYKIILVGAVAVHFIFSAKDLNSALLTIRYADATGWEIGEGTSFEPVEILKSTVLTTFAIWLHLKSRNGARFFGEGKRTLLVMSDALPEDDYRRLIVKLKTSAIQ